MKLKKIAELGIASVVSLSSLLAIGIPLASAATVSWTGGGGADSKFSTAANWAGGVVPVAGDTLNFPYGAGVTSKQTNNDLAAGTSFAGISFTGSPAVSEQSYGYSLYGNAVKLAGAGVSVDTAVGSSNANSVGVPIEFTADQTFTIGDGTSLFIAGILSGTGNLTKTGMGSLSLEADNAFTGTFTSNGGRITANSPTAFGATSAGTTIGANSDVTFSTCTGTSDSTTIAEPLTLIGATAPNMYANYIPGKINFSTSCLGGGGAQDEYYGFDTTSTHQISLTGSVTLGSDITIGGDAGLVTLSGALSGGYAIGRAGLTASAIAIAGSSNTTKTPNGTLPQAPTLTKTLSDDQSSHSVKIANNAVVSIDGKRGDVVVDKGGALKGTGVVGSLYVASGGIVAPGHSPGCLTTSDFTLRGTYQAQIGGTDPCTGYDQLKVTGTVDLGTSPSIGTLETSLYGGFVPKVGQSYTIINNDAADAVTGTFTGLAEGALFTKDGVTYKITYKGGDGNDVVLTVTSVNAAQLPKTPNTGFNLVSAHPLMTLGTTVTAALALLVAARKFKPVK